MFSVINIGQPEWVGTVIGLPPSRRDIHFDQRSLCPYVVAYGWRGYLARTELEGGYIAQPILVTPEGELRHAYNFGGPISLKNTLSLGDHAYNLKEWAKKQGCTTEFGTLVPSLASEQVSLLESADIKPEFRKNSVIVNLKNQKIRGTTRRLANKAQSAGITVKTYPYEGYGSHFIKIYNDTMDRVNAKDHWRFTDKWFDAFARFIKPVLMLASLDEKFIAGCMIAYSQQYPVAYYHFAGCLSEYLGTGVNQRMVLAACEFVRSVGLNELYLGGGITNADNDGLLTFKSGFSQLRLPVYSYERPL